MCSSPLRAWPGDTGSCSFVDTFSLALMISTGLGVDGGESFFPNRRRYSLATRSAPNEYLSFGRWRRPCTSRISEASSTSSDRTEAFDASDGTLKVGLLVNWVEALLCSCCGGDTGSSEDTDDSVAQLFRA